MPYPIKPPLEVNENKGLAVMRDARQKSEVVLSPALNLAHSSVLWFQCVQIDFTRMADETVKCLFLRKFCDQQMCQ